MSPTFQIKNLGFIKSGGFEVKPLTIFCGPNNTGKTWAMYALYGCLDRLPNGMPLPELDDITATLAEAGEYAWDMRAWVEKNHKRIIELIHLGCQRRLARVFNVDNDVFSDSSFDWQIDREYLLRRVCEDNFDFRLEVGKQVDALRILKPSGSATAQFTLLAGKLPDIKRFISDAVVEFLLQQHPDRNVFLVPAERNGLHLFFRELSSRRSALLHHAARDEIDIHKLINDVLKSRYAEPIADYIDWLNDLRSLRKTRSELCRERADFLRKELIGGKYDVDAEGVISFTPQKQRGKPAIGKLSLHLTSSTIKSMFGLWFFLEHQAKPGDVLMIDEPELNLHPGAQRRMARILAAVANQGITVIVSTHSDYFVREINSLIMLSRDHTEKLSMMKKFDYKENELLRSEDVGAYIFDEGKASPMDVSDDEGILASTFDTVIHDLNETNDAIYYAYRDSGESDF